MSDEQAPMDEQAHMEELLAVEAAPVVPQLHPVRWMRENLFPSPVSSVLTVVTAVAIIGLIYGALSWVFAPQSALVPLDPVSADEFVAYYEGDLPEGVELDARTIILLNPDAAVGGGAGSVATFEFVPGEEYVVAQSGDGDVTARAPSVPVDVDAWVLDLLLEDLNRRSRVAPDEAVVPGDRLAISTTTIEFEVPPGVTDVTGFAQYLLTTDDAAGWRPTEELVEGTEDEYVYERVSGLDPDDYITTAADVRRLNGLDQGETLVPGDTYRVEGSARQWNAISTNSRNYATLAYPSSQYGRVWLSFGITLALIGLSLAAWTNRPKVSSARLARKVTVFGAMLAFLVLLAPWSFNVDLSFIVIGLLLAVAGFYGRRWLLRRHGGERGDVPLMGMVLFFVVAIVALMWILPEVIDKVEIAASTKVPMTVMAGVAVAAFWAGKAVRTVAPLGALKGVLIACWALSMPVIYLVILRDPHLDFRASDVLIGVAVAVIGAALVWFMSGASAGEAGKAVAGMLVVIAILSWAPYEVITVGVVLVAGAVLATVWLSREPSLERALVVAALVAAAVLVWFFFEIREVESAAGQIDRFIENRFLEQIKTKLLLGGLASFGLAASAFGGNVRARASLTGAWVAAAAAVTWFAIISEGGTSIEIQSDYLGGLTLTVLLAFGGILLSFPIGVMLALGRTSTMPIFRLLSTSYIETVRGVPLITVLFFGALFLPLFLPADLRIAASLKALIAITGFSGAYLAENVRGGLQSISKGQYEASQALGMSTVQMTIFITLPQALRAVIPALVGQVIALFKDTSLVAIIGLADLLLVARAIVPGQPAFIGSQLENLLFVAIVYWIFTFSFSRASLRIERKLGLGER